MVTTLVLAWKPLWVTMRSVNSLPMSTLDCSRNPVLITPRELVLGKPIIGTKESVSGFRQNHLRDYMSRRYVGDNVRKLQTGYVRNYALGLVGGLVLMLAWAIYRAGV